MSNELSKRIANLSPEKRAELLKKMAAQKAAPGNTVRGLIPLQDRSRPLPLSFAQQRMWFIDQLAPGSPLFNVPMAVRLEGPLAVDLLERSLREVVRRHEVLRTTFREDASGPVLVIAPEPVLTLERSDLTGAAPDEAWRLAREAAARPFDLARGPLLRALLLTSGPTEHLLVVVLHHIISDGWSMTLLVREVALLYGAFARGVPAALPELGVQYADFGVWQREWLQGPRLEKQLGYWKQQLAGVPSALELPTDLPRPAIRDGRGARHDVHLPRELMDAMKTLAQQEGASLFMVLLAGWQVLMSRYTGQEDVTVGSPMAGRTRGEVEGLIGLFVNVQVLRTQVEGSASFRSLLRQVRDRVLGAQEHQDLPIERLVEELRPERIQGRTPFFQVMLTFQASFRGAAVVEGVKLEALELDTHTAKFDLTLQVLETEHGLKGYLEYATDLYTAPTVARMAGHLRVLLEGAVTRPDETATRLPLLTDAERQQVLVEWNDTDVALPAELGVAERFAAQARLAPDALAVVAPGAAALTYGELDAQANQLAHHLRSLGVGPEVLVGVCLERTPRLLVALLGILKAGGAYVPLDPSYPADRLAMMVSASRMSLLLTQQSLEGTVEAPGLPRYLLDAQAPSRAGLSTEAPARTAQPENLAYVVFTSGSTGTPKGVMVSHRNWANAYLGWERSYALKEQCRSHLQMASFSFDVFGGDLSRALCSGGKLVLCPREWLLEPKKLHALMEAEAVDCAEFVPAVLRGLLQHLEETGQRLESMKVLIAGSDAWYVNEYQRIRGVIGEGTRLINSYGISETTIDSTWFESDTLEAGDNRLVPIGKPFANVRMYVLDAALRPVPAGVASELFIGGEGVTRGYCHRPELTAERFVPNPHGAPGSRLYRSGDRARYLADGNIEFLGRADTQVKLRGFRVELGEIESVLGKHPAVRTAVVLVRENPRRLIAYVVAPEGTTSVQLRDFLREQLPEYMVPAAFVVLDALPLTPNGKVDRKALPTPDGAQETAHFVAPRTPTEELLAQVWAQVLGVARVGAEDNFFDLGGHSLLATQLVARVRAALDVELPLRALFEAPTVARLAERVQQASTAARLPPLTPTRTEGPQPLSFAQQRLWFLDQLAPDDASYNLPAALRLSGRLDVEALRRAFEALVARHEALRTTFFEQEGQPFQRIHAPATWALPVEDLSALDAAASEAETLRLATREARQPFHLVHGPLLRTSLLRLSEEAHVLLVTMHHIVSDAWSMGVLVKELAASYAAFSAGQEPSLPPLPVQYADFAAWQRQWLQGEVLETQLGYWKHHLAGAPSALELPTDRPRPPVQSRRGATVPVNIPAALTRSLRGLAQREGATPFMLLLSAFQLLLSRYSAQDDVSVGSPIAGRTHTEAEGLIGFFVNTLVLRARMQPRDSFRTLLAQVRGTTLAAYEHQHVPFEKLVEVLQPSRDLSRSPLFQVMFVLQNAPAEALRVPGLSFQPVPLEGNSARFDLALTLFEVPQGLTGFLEYSSDLFDAATVQRLMGHYGVLLEAIAAQPEAAIASLPLLTATEQQRLLVEWNATDVGFPSDTCIHHVVAEQARRAPDAVAVRMGERSVTYAGLEAWAHQLAVQLHAAGVSRGDRVAVLAERSPELVAGLLATLKVGAAYVPIAPGVPPERLTFMLEDSAASVLLTQQHLRASLPTLSTRVFSLEAEVAEQRAPLPVQTVGAEDLAYVIYTSGSTGRPKGVAVHHRGLMNLVTWHQRTYALAPSDKTALTAGVAFDASTWEVWPSLASGASLVVPPDAVRAEPSQLLRWLATEAITTCFMPTPLAEAVLREEWPRPMALRALLTGGDALHHGPPASVPTTLFNHYGPTESTVVATFTPVAATARDDGTRPPIGRPIANTRTYVLDAHLRPVPIGVPGELFLASEGLAWGYLGQPALSAERFIPH
ncbi:amino acid adenylation domain-containing protein, partial [Corallococcus sp. CA053C]|uniref:non-ribosomal peptide synthetase n=1 Tax=Corallococcus sp. CA053C TaxID=2316732 RepID=UPI000EA2EF4F